MSKIREAADMAELMQHFRLAIDKKLVKFVRDDVLNHSSFFFYQRMPRSSIYKGVCTYCKEEYSVRDCTVFKHNTWWRCEKCGESVQLKAAGRGRGKMVDRAYAVWYEKSAIDSNVIVSTGYKVTLDYRKVMTPEIEFVPVTRYLFRHGHSAQMAVRDHWTTGYYMNKQIEFGNGWSFTKRPSTIVGKYYFTRRSCQSKDSVREAVKGTPFERSEWQQFWADDLDAAYIFSAIAKYPFIEYLVKTGLRKIAIDIVRRNPTYGAINLRGKSPSKILGLNRQEFREWKATCPKMKAETLKAYKWCRDRGARISWAQAEAFGDVIAPKYSFDSMKQILQYVPAECLIRYSWNQYQKNRKHYREIRDVMTTYRDYLRDAKELEMDMLDEATLYPNNLRAAHAKTISKVKLKQDPKTNQMIVDKQKALMRYCFEHGNFLIRPIQDVGELFAEGASLNHCVGSYAKRYATGDCIILCVRRKDIPDEPFYTAEIVKDRLMQCRTDGNDPMTPEVKIFMDEYMKYLSTESKPRRTKQKMEVAV
ncbi:PcfJ domain-containing protein [Paenibacillus tyrfis]|uniref:PcfJ-like protein n=1 Tax=Paenibacillus tyrfis TaxID=1501230 RepID=A0A081NWN6_9BACL|nr:PcfJ domain-containing protein [Paenibacillus tyrfis]KEQ22859.1 hypothetical protein ET33_21150 [Paenibacillus tyrfis]